MAKACVDGMAGIWRFDLSLCSFEVSSVFPVQAVVNLEVSNGVPQHPPYMQMSLRWIYERHNSLSRPTPCLARKLAIMSSAARSKSVGLETGRGSKKSAMALGCGEVPLGGGSGLVAASADGAMFWVSRL